MSNSPKPTFIVVGAARSGTTSLYDGLRAHPRVYMSVIKETNFFTRACIGSNGPGDHVLTKPLARNPDGSFVERHAAIVQTWEDYTMLFAGSEEFVARGEISPSYLYYPQAAVNIKEVLPDCKIVILLRNPVERAFSAYKALVKWGRENLDFEAALAAEARRMGEGWEPIWALKESGLYASQVKQYLDLFPREQIGVWLSEEMVSTPDTFYRKIFQFLGVEGSYSVSRSPRNASEDQVGVLRRFLNNHQGIATIVRKLLPDSTRTLAISMDSKVFSEPVTMSLDTRRRLLTYFREDVLQLQKLLPELDVMQWVQDEEVELHHVQ
jgi:hypothetical protein